MSTTSITVRAAACNMAALITWKISGGVTAGAQGVRITRIGRDGSRKVLSSPTPYPNETGTTQPSDTWPIQNRGRYYDFQPALGEYKYEVALMVGQPGKLTASPTVVATSKFVNVTTKMSEFISACFNWGICSTQYVSRWIEENCGKGALAAFIAAEAKAAAELKASRQPTTPAAPGTAVSHLLDDTGLSALSAQFAGFTPEKFLDLSSEAHTESLLSAAKGDSPLAPLSNAIRTPGNELRDQLAVGIIEFLKGMIETAAKDNGHIYDLSYEVTDQEWIDFLVKHSKLLSIIIASIGTENEPAIKALQASAAEVFIRLLKNKYGIFHQKLQVRSDSKDVAQEVASGAVNKTSSGFCGQMSNAVRVLSQALATQVMEYRKVLLADTKAGSAQGPALRQWCNKFQDPVTLPDGSTVQLIMAPNNLSEDKPTTGLTPGMTYISNLIDGLEDGDVVVGNFFIPGHIGTPDLLAQAKIKKPGIIMKVAVSAVMALPAQQPPTAPGEDPVFVVAQPIKQPFANLIPELLGLPGAHAYIHSKTLVIYKAKLKMWIVVTGSHNQGEKADDVNDDNLLIFKGCTLLGLAYFVNNLSGYDHFLFRYKVNFGKAGTGYLDTTGAWQTLTANQAAEIDAIMNALASLDDVTPVSDDPSGSQGSGGSEDTSTTDKPKRKPGGRNPKPAPSTGPKARCKTSTAKGKAPKATPKAKPRRKTTPSPKKTKACPKPSRKTTPRRKK